MRINLKSNHFPYLLTFALLIFLPFGSHARNVRAIFLGATADSPKEATLVYGGEHVTISVPRRFLSEEVDLPSGALRLAVLPKPPPPDVEINPNAPSIVLPEGSNRSLLLFFPDPSNNVFPVRVLVVDASPTSFPVGHSILFNLSNASIAAKFGDQNVLVEAGKKTVVSPPIEGSGSYPVQIAFKNNENSNWVTIASSTWRHYPAARQLLFVTQTNGRKSPRVWSILDRTLVVD